MAEALESSTNVTTPEVTVPAKTVDVVPPSPEVVEAEAKAALAAANTKLKDLPANGTNFMYEGDQDLPVGLTVKESNQHKAAMNPPEPGRFKRLIARIFPSRS